jgi:hypothetical protein
MTPVTHTSAHQRQNLLAVYSDQPLQWAQPLGMDMRLPVGAAQPLTDNFAPIEALWQRCAG